MWVIVKRGRVYEGGPGYAGPACEAAAVEPGEIYSHLEPATRDAAILGHFNPVGFEVVRFSERVIDPTKPRFWSMRRWNEAAKIVHHLCCRAGRWPDPENTLPWLIPLIGPPPRLQG